LNKTDKYRRQICEFGHLAWQRGLIAANDGNFSIRVAEDRILITPGGVTKGFLQPSGIVEITAKGKVLHGGKPSSEFRMHLKIFENRPDFNAIVHTHAPYATAFALAGRDLTDPIFPEVIATIGKVPLVPYATPSTTKLAREIARFIRDYDVLLLKNHGIVAGGINLPEAYAKMERTEHICKIMSVAQMLGKVNQLGLDEVTDLLKNYHSSARIIAQYQSPKKWRKG